jgi:beta-glucosidase
VAILALGESSDMTGEAAARAYLDLPGNQEQLLEAVVATGKPVVLLLFSGRPLVLDWAAQHVPAIMEVWFAGVETGPAITGTLFGDTAPSGKLTMSFPRAVGQEPLYYNQLPTGRPIQHADPAHPGYVEMKYVSRYLDVPNDALFPFGHGLTYSTFGYSGVSLSLQSISSASLMRDRRSQPVVATTTVTNTGLRRATEIVECYVNIRGASTEQPVRNLKGFARITLDPGQSQTVHFPLGFSELSFYNVKVQQVVEPAVYTVYVGGSSTATDAATFTTTP